jgi:hypothetical protein
LHTIHKCNALFALHNFDESANKLLDISPSTRGERSRGNPLSTFNRLFVMMMMMMIVLEIFNTCSALRIAVRIPVVLPGQPFPRDVRLNPLAQFLVFPSISQHFSA